MLSVQGNPIPSQWRSYTRANPGLARVKFALARVKFALAHLKNFYAVPRAVKAFSLRVVILINVITAYAKSLEYSSL